MMHRDDNKLEAMLERVLRKMQADSQTGWMTLLEAAACMRCTLWHVRRMCQKRKIPFTVVGHRHVVCREDCDAYMKSRREP